MPDYYCTANIAANSGETADTWVNTFAVQNASELTGGQVAGWSAALATFYNTIKAGGAMYSRTQSGHVFKFLAAVIGSPNYPLFEESFTFSSPVPAIDLPLEVSLCISYMNDSQVQLSRACRRGRIYVSGFPETGNTVGRPTAALQELLADAYLAYVEDVNNIGGLSAGVWSRKLQLVLPVDRVWVDNEWDTMRSRGTRSTDRYSVLV